MSYLRIAWGIPVSWQPPMVEIAERVWARWREARRGGWKPSIVLMFSSDLDDAAADDAVQSAVWEVVGEAEREDAEEVRAGEWTIGRTSGGVLVRVHDCDVLEPLLRQIAARLELRGASGNFDVFQEPSVPELPDAVDFIECRLRVAGHRSHVNGPVYRWHPDLEAFWSIVRSGIRWCIGNGAREASVQASTLPYIALRVGDAEQRLREGLDVCLPGEVADLTTVTSEGFRMLAVDPAGRVTLIEGQPGLRRHEWQHAVERLTRFIEVASDHSAYAFVKRGSDLPEARRGESLSGDWPLRLPFDLGDVSTRSTLGTPETRLRVRIAGALSLACTFEDRYVPDAFGVQYLGAGFAGRVPEPPGWRARTVGAGVVLEHDDPSAWFDQSFAPFGGKWPSHESRFDAPEVLVRAREDLASILFHERLVLSR